MTVIALRDYMPSAATQERQETQSEDACKSTLRALDEANEALSRLVNARTVDDHSRAIHSLFAAIESARCFQTAEYREASENGDQ